MHLIPTETVSLIILKAHYQPISATQELAVSAIAGIAITYITLAYLLSTSNSRLQVVFLTLLVLELLALGSWHLFGAATAAGLAYGIASTGFWILGIEYITNPRNRNKDKKPPL